MRGRRKLTIVLAATVLAVIAGVLPASAGVERYQFKKIDWTVDYTTPSGSGPDRQYFTMDPLNPCDGSFSGGGTVRIWGATATQGTVDGSNISYTTRYLQAISPLPPNYTVTVVNATLDAGGLAFSGTWFDGFFTFPGDPGTMTATGEVIWTSDYNHGEYVAKNVEEHGPLAHSCIGMPKVSRR